MKWIAAVLMSSCAFCQTAALPSAEAVMKRYIDALGGSAAIGKVETRVAQGSFEVPTFGASGKYTEYAKAPGKVLQTFNVENYGVVQRCFDGQAVWAEDPENGVEDPKGARAAEMKRSAGLLWPARLAAVYAKLVVTGKAKAGERDAFVVDAVSADGVADKLFFDCETGLLVRLESNETARTGDAAAFVMHYEDYRAVDGVKVPYVTRFESAAMTWIVRLATVVNGAPVEDSRFKKPGA